MAESRLEREQRRLATKMNVPYVEEKLYAKNLRNRDMPYETRLLTARISQQSNPTPNLALLTAWISKQRNQYLGIVNLPSKIAREYGQKFDLGRVAFRLRSPPTTLEELMNYTPDQRDIDILSGQFPSIETQPVTNWTPQPPTWVRKEQPHPKLYSAKRNKVI